MKFTIISIISKAKSRSAYCFVIAFLLLAPVAGISDPLAPPPPMSTGTSGSIAGGSVDGDNSPAVPIDGGLSLLVAAGVGFGAKKWREHSRKKAILVS